MKKLKKYNWQYFLQFNPCSDPIYQNPQFYILALKSNYEAHLKHKITLIPRFKLSSTREIRT